MTDPQAFHDPDESSDPDIDNFATCVEWVRAAGDFLEVSEDLRPATLESARSVAHEKRASGAVLVAAVIGLLLAVPPTPDPLPLGNSTVGKLGFASSQELFQFVGERGAETGRSFETGWNWVEAFRQVQRQRSAALGRRQSTPAF